MIMMMHSWTLSKFGFSQDTFGQTKKTCLPLNYFKQKATQKLHRRLHLVAKCLSQHKKTRQPSIFCSYHNHTPGPTSTETFMCFQQISPTVTHQSHWLPWTPQADWGNVAPLNTPDIFTSKVPIQQWICFRYNLQKKWRTISDLSDLEVGRLAFIDFLLCQESIL